MEQAGILSQYRPASLMDHVGTGKAWDLVGSTRGVRFLPPHTGISDSDWYRGTADALYQNISFMERSDHGRVLILSGDHIYKMNYEPLIRLHERKGADVTIAVTPVRAADARRYGLVSLNSDSRVLEYREKPRIPISNLASMTVYLFEKSVLIKELKANALAGGTYQIYEGILPGLVAASPCVGGPGKERPYGVEDLGVGRRIRSRSTAYR